MSEVIIYINDANKVCVIYPAPEAVDLYGIEAIALKDVPGPKTVYDVPTGEFRIAEQGEQFEEGERYEVMGPRVITYPFKIMDEADVPPPDEWASWEVDPATLTDGVGGNFDSFE